MNCQWVPETSVADCRTYRHADKRLVLQNGEKIMSMANYQNRRWWQVARSATPLFSIMNGVVAWSIQRAVYPPLSGLHLAGAPYA